MVRALLLGLILAATLSADTLSAAQIVSMDAARAIVYVAESRPQAAPAVRKDAASQYLDQYRQNHQPAAPESTEAGSFAGLFALYPELVRGTVCASAELPSLCVCSGTVSGVSPPAKA